MGMAANNSLPPRRVRTRGAGTTPPSYPMCELAKVSTVQTPADVVNGAPL